MSERIFNAETLRQKAALKTPHSKRWRVTAGVGRCAKRLECGVFSAAFRSANIGCGFAAPRLCASALTGVFLSLLVTFSSFAADQIGELLYHNDFEQAPVDKIPAEFLVLDGGFAVKEINGNKVLQLPGAPLETFGVLFGTSESADTVITARIHGTGKGRRFPAFAVGLNGNAGFKLQVAPAKKLIELYKADEVLATAAFTWESDSWTQLKLQVRKVKDGEFAVEGKAWKQGTPEPDKWLIAHTERTEAGKEPHAGRASVWGNPFAGTPIDFDDLVVRSLPR